ncbi:MAG: nitroreductase family protein [Gammaproteobacteria bacterium]
MFNKKIDINAPIHELIATRWSGRAYDPSKLIERKEVISLLEAARWAPSCFGYQPWRYIICDKALNGACWTKLLECLSEGNQSWAKNAPLLLLATADLKNSNNDLNKWSEYDTGAASQNLSIQATALGLMVHQMGGFDVDKSRNNFKIPNRYMPMAVISVGYQLPEDKIPEEMKEREYSHRVRNSISENFFEGEWENPIQVS